MIRRTGWRKFLILLLATLCAGAATAGASHSMGAAVRQHLGADFSGVVLTRASLADQPVIRAFGMANLETGRAMHPDSPFQIGSVSKWITALAVLRLADQGKLELDVPIGAYLPEMPAHSATTVTLRHLLSNSAGIPDGVMQEFKKDKSIADLRLSHLPAALRFAGGAPAFKPGSGWAYAPTTWVVVAAIIERVTGQSYAQAVDKLVLRPAKAFATAVPGMPFKDLPNATMAYRATAPRQLHMSPHVVFVAASGTIHSTAADLARLARHVYETDFLSRAARVELSRIMVPAQHYALGGRVKTMELGGSMRTLAWETGATGAFKSLLAYEPGKGTTVVILNNTDMDQSALDTAAQALLRSIAR